MMPTNSDTNAPNVHCIQATFLWTKLENGWPHDIHRCSISIQYLHLMCLCYLVVICHLAPLCNRVHFIELMSQSWKQNQISKIKRNNRRISTYRIRLSYLMRVSQPRIHDCITIIALSRFFSSARSSRAAFVLSKKLIFCDSLVLNMILNR